MLEPKTSEYTCYIDRDFENAQCFEDIVHLINLRAVADWIKVIIHQYLMTFLMIASPMYFPDKIQFEIGEYVNIVLGRNNCRSFVLVLFFCCWVIYSRLLDSDNYGWLLHWILGPDIE